MSDFFDKLKKGIDKGVTKASKKSAELAEKTKLQTQIMSLKNERKNEINELGNLTYELLKQDNLDEEALYLKFEKIKEIEKEISEKEYQKENIIVEEQDIKEDHEEILKEEKIICPHCGEENSIDAKFCKNCGSKLD